MAEERRLVTVLFADVAGSTALGEQLDPEDLRSLLGRLFAVAAEVVADHGGSIEKFIGDAIVAVFGLPSAHDDDAARALSAALELRDRVRADPILGERVAIRLGLNTGEVVASRDQSAGQFLMTGDAVNVAARLEQAAEPWTILVGERTARAAAGGFRFGRPRSIDARGKSAPVAAVSVEGRAAPGVRRVPLVGRETDLEQLELVARRTFRERRPYLVSLIAPPGIGKSRLLEEFVDRLATLEPAATVAIAHCLPYGQRLTYWPLRGLLLRLLELPERVEAEAIRLAARSWLAEAGDPAPDRTAELLAVTIGAGEGEATDRSALFAAWRTAIELQAARRPLVLVVEDLHWSSDTLLDLVEFVLRPRADGPVLMLALSRPELLDRRPSWGGGRRNYVSLELEALPDDAVERLVEHLLDGPAPEVVSRVVARAEGNPFYAGEIVRAILERTRDAPGEADIEEAVRTLPDTVQATVLSRLDLLAPAARRVLQLGAILGRTFRPDDIEALEPAFAGTVGRGIDELLARDLVRAAPDGSTTFRHILIREVAYGTLPRVERARLHARAGAALEKRAAGREDELAELIAFHYREAAVLGGRIGEAVDVETRRAAVIWLQRAADAALSAAASVEGIRHLRAAIDLADPEELPDLHLRLGLAYSGGDVAVSALETAYRLGRDAGRSPDFLLLALAERLMLMTRFFASVARQPSEGEFADLLAEARTLFERATDPRAKATLLVAEGFVPFWQTNSGRRPADAAREAARRAGTEGVSIAESLGDIRLVSAGLDGLASMGQASGARGVLAMTQRRLELEDRLPTAERLDAYNMTAWSHLNLGELDAAERAAEQGLASVQPGQHPEIALGVANWHVLALGLQGRWDQVPVSAERCRRLWLEAERPSAGYALPAFLMANDVATARRDDESVATWRAILDEIIGAFPARHPTSALASLATHDPVDARRRVISQWDAYLERLHYVERALALCADRREPVPSEALAAIIRAADELQQPLVAAQVRRVRGVQEGGPEDFEAALLAFDGAGAGPDAARVRVELGRLVGRPDLEAAGLRALEAFGDVEAVDRYLRGPD